MAIQSNFPAIRPSLLLDFANSKRLDPRITFTRASTARFYDGSTVAKAEENLLQQSQTFENTFWVKNECVITTDTTTAPDGTSTADTLTPNATSSIKWIHSAAVARTSGLTYTASVFAKPNGYQYLQISLSGNSFPAAGRKAAFDLTDGTFVAESGVTAQAVSAGNGWYRISVTVTANASFSADYAIGIVAIGSKVIDDTTFLANGTSGYYLWGAQLEQRSAVTAYTATTTAPITNYVPQLLTAASGVPRFDHDPVTGESLGLLIEEQRTNLCIRSEEFDNAVWSKTDVTVTANAAIAPDGTLTADTLTSVANVNAIIFQSITFTGDGEKCVALYLKAGTSAQSQIRIQDATAAVVRHQIRVIWTAGVPTLATVVGTGTLYPVKALGNGWYRILFSATGIVAANINRLGIYPDTPSGTGTVYAWGAQVENATFPTSYIPTVAATATRQADAASMTGTNFSSWYDAAEGTLYVEAAHVTSGNRYIFGISNNTSSNRMLGYTNATNGLFLVTTSGTAQASISTGTVTSNVFRRTAYVYKVNDFAAVANAGTVNTDTAGTIPVVDRLYVGADESGTGQVNGTIRKLAYYPIRATDAQIQAITG